MPKIVQFYDYKLGTWRSSVLGLFDFMIVRCDRPHRHVEIISVGIWTSRVPMVHELSMYFKDVSCIYSRESTWHLRHIISWCCIALHLITSFILI